jgi:predicted transcriptional regulator YheO
LRMKGAVSEIAQQLKISEPSVYRYLNRSIEK